MFTFLVWMSSSMGVGVWWCMSVMASCRAMWFAVGGTQDGCSWTEWSCKLQVTISTNVSMRNECCNVGVVFWPAFRTWAFFSTFAVEASHAALTWRYTWSFPSLLPQMKHNWFYTWDFPVLHYFSPMLLTYCLSFPIPIWHGLRLWAIV